MRAYDVSYHLMDETATLVAREVVIKSNRLEVESHAMLWSIILGRAMGCKIDHEFIANPDALQHGERRIVWIS